MKHFKNLLCMLSVLAICACFLLTAQAADEENEPALKVFPTEERGDASVTAPRLGALLSTDPVPTYSASDKCLELIKKYEGFTATPYQDTYGLGIGYGTSYAKAQEKYGEDCAPITEEQGEELLREDLAAVEESLKSFLVSNRITVNQNQFDALASFTYNVGIGWTIYKNDDGTWCKLKVMLLDDPSTWSAERTQEAFGTWVNDGNGNQLAGLVRRRAEEAELFLTPCEPENLVFSDVRPGVWYYDYVMEAYEKGLMKGLGGGIFAPEETLTRAQLVQALANFDGVDLGSYTASSFSDVPEGVWFTAPVAWASEQGYVLGFGDGTFQPNEIVTREQVCTILARYLTAHEYAAGEQVDPFTDDGEISSYARAYVYFCASLELVNGMGDGSFSPQSGTTRAQAATILVRMCDLG